MCLEDELSAAKKLLFALHGSGFSLFCVYSVHWDKFENLGGFLSRNFDDIVNFSS